MFRKIVVTSLKNLFKQSNNYAICLQLPVFRLLHNNTLQCQHAAKNTYLIDENGNLDINDHKGCNKFTERTHNCGELRSKDVGQKVTLCGWLEFQRMNKFIIMRDAYGHTQLLINDQDTATQELLSNLPYESIIKAKGIVLSRPKDMINPKQLTGEIEILVDSFQVLNGVKHQLPFNIRKFQKAKENLRMRYRYLDLRFPEMQRNLRVRSKFLMDMRNFLVNNCQFVEVETPTLFKMTPGGAQEFIVPTRFPGQFYSLVQSPQQFKQILMAGAVDRYFQIARCYRDEGCRSDRQPEFTQLDIEMSFTSTDGVIKLIEELLQYSWPDFLPPLPYSFPRISFKEAMESYGSDKPDLRYEFKIQNCRSAFENNCSNFGAHALIFNEPLIALSKSTKEKVTAVAQKYQNVKFITNKILDIQDWIKKISRLLGEDTTRRCVEMLNIKNNSVIFMAYGNQQQALSLLGNVRLQYCEVLESEGHKIKKPGMHPLWVVDFPLFEKNQEENLESAHHPFTAPHAGDVHLLESSPLNVRAQAYDLVLNGNEIGGGSIRIHDPLQQEVILKMLNIEKNILGHMLEMLGSGCPPHGGIALGLDRLLATILETTSIRDVIAFPKSFEGRDLLSGAPSPVPDEIKKLYHIKVDE